MDEGRVVGRWIYWPQWIAPNVVKELARRAPRGRKGVSHKGKIPGYHTKLLACARALSERFNPPLPLSKIIVFYPRRLRGHVTRNIDRWRIREGDVLAFKDLTIAATPRLKWMCQAFRIKDVESHLTPADAYHTDASTPTGRVRSLRPKALYSGKEPGTGGKPIHE